MNSVPCFCPKGWAGECMRILSCHFTMTWHLVFWEVRPDKILDGTILLFLILWWGENESNILEFFFLEIFTDFVIKRRENRAETERNVKPGGLFTIASSCFMKKVKVTQSCLTLCSPLDCIVLQARILEWVAFPFSRGSFQPRDQTQVSRIAGGFFTNWATREAQEYWSG